MVHFKLNERGGGLQAAIVNYSSQVDLGDMSAKQLSSMWWLLSILFSQWAKPLKESGVRRLWQRLFFISRCHLPSCTGFEEAGTEWVKKKKGRAFSKLVTWKDLWHCSQHFSLRLPPPPSFSVLSLSLYIYLISPTKPITAMFLQPLQSHSASYWPFTRLPYNTHNHWISNPLLELE